MLLSKIFWRPIMGVCSITPLYLTNVPRSLWESFRNSVLLNKCLRGCVRQLIIAAAAEAQVSHTLWSTVVGGKTFEWNWMRKGREISSHLNISPSLSLSHSLFTCCLGMFFVDGLPQFVYGCRRSCVWVANSQAFVTEFAGFEKFTFNDRKIFRIWI